MSVVTNALAKCKDMEIRMTGHVATGRSASDIGNNDWAITIADDVQQGRPGGLRQTIVIHDADNPLFADNLQGSGWSSDLKELVIECPIPPPP
ncbi:MAG: hypothetical protein ACI9QL_004200 [Candidatus Omnitrophota bacterium]|jgi:hypothetical protein